MVRRCMAIASCWMAAAVASLAGDWVKLDKCRLLPDPSNDGDSFHVNHGGREYIFRLYFVDCPEAEDHVKERVDEQAAFFGVPRDRIIPAGRAAARFTASALRGTFTVYTLWEDAKGDSQLRRYFAIVNVDGKDLAALLAENGLCRVYGKMVDAPGGRKSSEIAARLDSLAQSAKRGNRGIWGRPGAAVAQASNGAAPEPDPPAATPVSAAAPPEYETVTCASRVQAFTPRPPYKPIGEFAPGTSLEIIARLPEGMAQVRFTSPAGKVTYAACKYFDLGIKREP